MTVLSRIVLPLWKSRYLLRYPAVQSTFLQIGFRGNGRNACDVGTILKQINFPIVFCLRTIHVTLYIIPTICLAAALDLIGQRTLAFQLLTALLKSLGGAFIKLGQWGSTRPDILPPELALILSQLHTNAPHHSFNWTRELILTSFGKDIEEIFDYFEKVPVGSGTIGQVYYAKLKNSSKPVAVKVLHPGIKEKIRSDLLLLKLAGVIADLLPGLKWIGISDQVKTFNRMMLEQLDLRLESWRLARFSKNFSKWKNVIIPESFPSLTSSSVMVQSYEKGVSLSSFLNSKNELNLDTDLEKTVWRKTCANITGLGLNSFLQMMLHDNFVHADLHPGNIYIRFSDKSGKYHEWKPNRLFVQSIIKNQLSPQIIFLDAGLVTQLSKKDFDNFSDLFATLVLWKDGYKAAELIVERSPKYFQRLVINEKVFYEKMSLLINPKFQSMNLNIQNLGIGETIREVFNLVRCHRVHLDSSFTNLVMSFLCVEGAGRILSPELNLLPFLSRGAIHYLVKNVAQNISLNSKSS